MSALQLVDRDTGEVSAPSWDDFWTLYPRRVAKKDALKAWGKLRPAQQMAAIVACAAWRKVWSGKDLDYLPYPASWLRGERWDDELPPEYTVSTAAHVAAVLPEATARTVMPDHVRALLAKLRAK